MSKIIPIVIQISVMLIVVSLGLRTRSGDVTGLLRRPGLLARSLLCLYVLLPAAVFIIVLVFDPIPPVKIALVLLAISPIPPILPGKQAKLSDDRSYIHGLLVICSLLSVAYIPLVVSLLGALTDRSVSMPAGRVFEVILLTVLAPLGAGMIVRAIAPAVGARIAPIAAKVGGALLLISLAFILIGTWRPVISLVGNGTVAIIALVVAIGLAIGHLLGGPDPDDRAALALAASAHHPGVAMAIAAATFPGNKAIAAAVILYLILNGILTLPYTARRKRALAAPNLEQRARLQQKRLREMEG